MNRRWALGVGHWAGFVVLLSMLGSSCAERSRGRLWRKRSGGMRRNRSDTKGLLQVLDAKGKVADKRWTFTRLGSHGRSKSVLRFLAPAEVKGVALLVVNHPDRASDQWMWTPALQRERRIALQDRSTRFFGTDFSFEDLEERDVNQFDYRLLGEQRDRRRPVLANRVGSVREKDLAIHEVRSVDPKGHLHARADRELHQDRGRQTARDTATSCRFKGSGPAGASR